MSFADFSVTFPVSGVTTSVFVPPLVAFAVSLLSSTGGLSGAFLLLPFQMSVLGFTTPAVSGTNFFYNVVCIPGGVWQYFREGRMAWALAGVMAAGTIPGTALGFFVRVRFLPDPRAFKLFVGCVLAYICGRLLSEALRGHRRRDRAAALEERFRRAARTSGGRLPAGTVRTASFSLTRVAYRFQGEEFSFSTPIMFLLSFAVGIVGGAYGIGGGAILAPFWVAVFRLPIYTVAGASLLGTFLTSVAGVLFYCFFPTGGSLPTVPDFALGALFGVGGLAGVTIGARLQKHLPPRLIKGILGVLIALVAVRYISTFFFSPGAGGAATARPGDGGWRILCAGDSITAAAYPAELQRLLDTAGIPAVVTNRGVNGHTSGEYLAYLKAGGILERDDPDVVLLQLGTNDVRVDGDRTATARFVSQMEEILDRVSAHRNARGRTPRILLATIPPVTSFDRRHFDASSARRVEREINPALERLAGKRGLPLVDNFRLFAERSALLPGIHPSPEGYRALAGSWFRALEPLLRPGGGGEIVFQSDRDGNDEIYRIGAEGGGLTRLTNNPASDGYPVWSPDGTRIAFESNRGGTFQIWTMADGGSDPRQVTMREEWNNRYPAWSADGMRILYESRREESLGIYATEIATGEETRVHRRRRYRSGLPDCSPDGASIAFTADRGGRWGVWVMHSDGTGVRPLDTEAGACRPHWSPDGSHIAYVSQRSDGKGDIWIMRADGTEKRRLTTEDALYDYFPAWSPDGSRIVYARTDEKKAGNWDLFIIDAAGSAPRRLTGHPARDRYPDWRPPGLSATSVHE